MPPKVKDPKAKQFYKASLNPKDLLPTSVKNPTRDTKPFKAPDPQNCQIKRLDPEFVAFKDPEDWPTDDQLKTVDFGVESNNQYSEPDPFVLPQSFTDNGKLVVFLRRPREFIKPSVSPTIIKEEPKLLLRKNTMRSFPEFSVNDFIDEEPEPVQITVCEQYDRLETQEEFEKRRKDVLDKIALAQATAKDKKKSKKVEDEVLVEPTEPGKIKDAKLNNIDMSGPYPADIRWIASVLQMIKDNNIKDIHTLKPITSKIYPQVDGMPVYNKSGKYWVRLYFMGKEKKIEIDDKIPINSKGESIYVRTTNGSELWSMLLCKALIKLCHSFKHFNNNFNLIGDGVIMYALTGLLCENINLQNIQSKEWSLVQKFLNDQSNQHNVVVGAYCNLDHVPQAQSNKLFANPEFFIQHTLLGDPINEEGEEFESSPTVQRKKNRKSTFHQDLTSQNVIKPQLVQQDGLSTPHPEYKKKESIIIKQLELTKEQKETNIQTGCAYSVIDFFTNETFNMVYVQKRSERELRLRQEYFEICKANIHKMTKEEKLEHRRRKKELKEKLGEEDHKRIEQITKPAHNHKLLRIKSGFQKVKNLNVACQFSGEEIHLAKKCMLNKLTKPPNYELPEIRGDDKSVVSANVKINPDEAFIPKPLDDFSSLNNVLEPVVKSQGGNWVMEKDFSTLFQYLQFYYNPKKYQTNQIIQHQLNQDYEIANNENQELLIVYRNPDQDEPQEIPLIFGFQPKYAQNHDLQMTLKPYAILQKYDLTALESIQDFKVLNNFVSSQMMFLENKNNVFRLNIYSPLSYTMQIASSNQIKLMSIPEYLIEFESQNNKQYTIEYPSIESNKYNVFARFKVIGDTEQFLIRFKNCSDFNILKYLRIKITEFTNETQMLTTIEGVHKNLYEKNININLINKIQIKKNTLHFVSIEGLLPYHIAEGQFELEILSRQEIQSDLVEHVEPQEFYDKYIPYKYGIIFREKIFSNEGTLATFYVKIAELIQNKDAVQDQKKGGKQTKNDVVDLQEIQLKEERSIKLELIKNEQVVAYAFGLNKAILSNLLLNNTKEETVNYILQCTFDLREWPNAKLLNADTENINFFITILATDTVGIVKDTTKEDKEKAIKKSWEDSEQGRAEKAKKSRRKHLLLLKKENGEQLNEEELQFINQPRLTKKQREENNQQQQAAKGKAAKKDEKKPAKAGKIEIVEEKKVERPFPASSNHQNEEIKSFLSKLEERVKEVLAPHAGLIQTRSEESKKELVEQAKIAKEDYTQFIQRSMMLREQLKLFAKDLKQQTLTDMTLQRKVIKEQLSQYLAQREELKNKVSGTQTKEKQLIEICKQEKPAVGIDELEKLLSEVSQIQDFKVDLIDIGKKVLKNIKITNLIDKLQNSLGQFELEMIKQCIDTINANSVEGVEQELIDKALEIIDEAAANPNFIAEKQAELKKGAKKGKK